MLPTESVYAAFVGPLQEFTKQFNDRTYINTSLVGAQIDGFDNISLDKALENTEIISPIKLEANYNCDISKIRDKIQIIKKELNEASLKISDGERLLKNFRSELNRYKSTNTEVLKALKKLSLNYLSLSEEFSAKSKVFDFITVAEKIDLDYEMKITKEFTPESVEKIANGIDKYYQNANSRSSKIINKINSILEVI